jgi:AraC family transcriptional regulator, transcriptional activator FtrA
VGAGARYVDDGKLITSTNLASGIDATLRAVSSLVGRTTAEDVARRLGYRYTRYLDDPSFRAPTMFLTPLMANAAYQPGREEMGVLLYDGVSEMALAGLLDPYTSSMVARADVFAPERRPVTSRNGLVFVPRFDLTTVPSLDRVVLPGGDATGSMQQVVNAWSSAHPGHPVEEIHRDVGAGGSAYDLTLLDIARRQNAVAAAAAGQDVAPRLPVPEPDGR